MSEQYRMMVYKYGVRGDLSDPVIQEIQRAHQLRNKLVEIERDHAEQITAVWAKHPEIAEAEKALNAAEQQVKELTKQANLHRQQARKRSVSPELAADLKTARAARRDAKAAYKAAKDAAYPMVKAGMIEARKARDAAVKATYRDWVDGGLYWATYNDVLASHKVAVDGIKKKRQAGRPAELRFHRFDGTGRITVQLQRGTGDPPRSPELLANGGGKWANVAQLIPWITPQEWESMTCAQQRRAGRSGRFTFRIGSGEHAQQVTIPVVVHRPMPPDADITMVRITRRRLAGRYKASISVVVRVPHPAPRTAGRLVAAHMGWRALSDGCLRVGVVTGAGRVPAALGDVVRDYGTWAEVVIPASWRKLHNRLAEIHSQRDTNLETLKSWLIDWFDRHPDAREHLDPEHTMHLWRAPGRFATLAIQHRNKPHRPTAAAQAIRRIEAWRRQDRHLWEWEANERDQLIGRRNHAWGRVAAWLTDQAAYIVVDGWDITQIATTPDVENDDDHQARAARANRTLAAPGELRAAIERAAEAHGIQLTPSDVATTATHHICKQPLNASQRAAQIMVWCTTCEVMVDQDHNALQHLIATVQNPK